MRADDSMKSQYVHSGIKSHVGSFQRFVCDHFIPSAPLPNLPFFWLSPYFLHWKNTKNPIPQSFFVPPRKCLLHRLSSLDLGVLSCENLSQFPRQLTARRIHTPTKMKHLPGHHRVTPTPKFTITRHSLSVVIIKIAMPAKQHKHGHVFNLDCFIESSVC